jgi:uncharacterized GH25 family protein
LGVKPAAPLATDIVTDDSGDFDFDLLNNGLWLAATTFALQISVP